jgi:hypothetical protein
MTASLSGLSVVALVLGAAAVLSHPSDDGAPLCLRIAASIPLFAGAALFAVRSWNPLGNGYFSTYPDDPDGLYLTVAATGIAIAAGVLTALRLCCDSADGR